MGAKSSETGIVRNGAAHDEAKTLEKPYRTKVIWMNAFWHFLMHAIAIYGFTIRNEAQTSSIIFWKLLHVASTLSVLAGAHRLYAHRTFKANPAFEFMMLLFWSFTYENSVFVWVRDHRLHHKHTETDADPHNSNRGFFFCHIGWLMSKKHPEVLEKGKETDMSDLEANKMVMFQHRHKVLLTFLCGIVFPMFVLSYCFGESLTYAFTVGVMYRYVTQFHITLGINSFAHMWGYKPYDKTIGPTESPLMMMFGFGEGFHNYHHSFPMDYRAAEYNGDVRNLTCLFIDLFAWLGWVTDLQTIKPEIIKQKAASSGDGTYTPEPTGVYKFFVDIPLKQLLLSRNIFMVSLFLYLL